jgi:hypothetical protein
VDAKKVRKGEREARQLLQGMERLVVCKGKKQVEFDLSQAPLSDEDLRKHVLGPTGNLRAPAIRRGKTLVVGFGEDAYGQELA